MTLASSGTITFAQIQTEFGGSNPIDLNEYYRGGTYVANTSGNSTIPTSGAIDLADFYSTSVGAVDMDGSYTIGDVDTPTATVALTAYRNGDLVGTGDSVSFSDTWIASGGSTIGDYYQVRLTVLSGTSPTSGSAVNSWLDLSSDQVWALSRSTSGTSTGTWSIEIRSKATTTLLDSAEVAVSAQLKE